MGKVGRKRTVFSPLKTWDFSLKKGDETSKDIRNNLRNTANLWAFQEEVGESGYKHWQGRIRLHKKKRKDDVLKLFSGTVFEKAHWSNTTVDVHVSKTFNYVIKCDTRVDGPWTDKMEEPEDMPWQLEEVTELRPWQQEIVTTMENQKVKGKRDGRTINVLYHPGGNMGGTIIKDWLRWNHKATVIPLMTDTQDICAMVMCKPKDTSYFIDMPRNVPRGKLPGFWNGVESIKDGYCWDKRNRFRDRLFGRPCIWIKTNELPCEDMLSRDRWKIWTVNDPMGKLVEYTPAGVAEVAATP